MSPENRHGLPGRLGAVPQARHSGGHDGRGGQSDTVPPAPPTVLTREAPRVRLAGSDGGPSQDKGLSGPQRVTCSHWSKPESGRQGQPPRKAHAGAVRDGAGLRESRAFPVAGAPGPGGEGR